VSRWSDIGTSENTDQHEETLMEKHVNLVGILNIVYRSLMIVGAFVLFFLAAIGGRIFEWLIRSGAIMPHEVPIELLDLIPPLLTLIGLLIFIVSTVAIVGAAGVLKHKEWGRMILLVVSFITLLRIPLGTALGAYSIWVLMNDETIRLFRSGVVTHAGV
jgi:hypothetical protein